MEANYYVTTLMKAGMKLGPPLLFIVLGYFIFIKLPFFFLRKNMAEQKKKLQEDNKDLTLAPGAQTHQSGHASVSHHEKKLTVEKPKLHALPSEPQKAKRAEQKTEQKTEQKKKEEPKKHTPPPQSPGQSPEEILGFKPNESFTKGELKKHYFDKLKENHPDRVASMGEDFKKLAERNTKEINKAYEKLKNRAA